MKTTKKMEATKTMETTKVMRQSACAGLGQFKTISK